MNRRRSTRMATLVGVALGVCLGVAVACNRPPAKKEYAFRGRVEQVDGKARTVSVNNENIPGWMMAMTMTYGVDKGDVLDRLKVGDQIAAKVYEGDFKTLYDVHVVEGAGHAQPEAK